MADKSINRHYDVSGMSCAACSSAIERTLNKLDGVEEVNVNLLTNSMNVTYDEGVLDDERIIEAVRAIGYGAEVKGKKKEVSQPDRQSAGMVEYLQMKQRLWISLALMIPLMILTMGPMVGIPRPSFLEGIPNAMTFALLQLLMTLPVLYVNRHFFINGFKALAHRVPNMDSLIAIGSAAAVVYGIYALFKLSYGLGHGDHEMVHHFLHDLYFESAAMILTLITVGKTLEARSKLRTSKAIEALMDLKPETAVVLRDGVEVELPIEDVVVGDLVIIRPGSKVPVDGTIVEGYSFLDESALTGESMPVEKQAGAKVYTATINGRGHLQVRADEIGEDTTFSKIIRLVEEANATKAPIAQMADKISGVFVPIVIVIALVASIVWLILGRGVEFALSIGISVLVISCPCALGLATPVAIMVGTGKGAQYGILFKDATSLEVLHHADTVVLDKTGTITQGNPVVTDIITLPGVKEEDLLAHATGLEQKSEHPIALAIVKESAMRSITPKETSDFEAILGRGVQAKIDGHLWRAGNGAMMDEAQIDRRLWADAAHALAEQAKTGLYIAKDSTVVAMIAVADVVKADAAEAIASLKAMDKTVWMLTGDNRATAEAMAKEVGIEHIIADVLPQDKEAKISQLIDDGHQVVMVGDGINDAPALARAHVGIAIGQGTDVAIESADVVLMKDQLRDLATAIELSKATIRTIKQNLFWALFYNSLGIPIAAGVFYLSLGWKLNPMIGAAAMGLSSLFVVSNALRLQAYRPESLAAEPTPTTCPMDLADLPEVEEREGALKNNEEEIIVEKKLSIEGMTCPHCVAHVQKALESFDGVKAEVDLDQKLATITGADKVTDEQLKEAVAEAGYEVVDIK